MEKSFNRKMKNGINEVYSYLKQFEELYGCDIFVDIDNSSDSNCYENAFYKKKKWITKINLIIS